MDEKKLLNMALEMGFANAALMDTAELVFIPAFRPLCEENLCGKYGVNYACPPDCGTVEEMRQRVLRWRRALVMQTMWDIEDPLNNEEIKPAKAQHNRMTRRLIDQAGAPGLMIGASGCSLCSPCAITAGEPCRFPEKRYSCMSAYCIFVEEMAKRCGMEYDCGPRVTAFFSMYCFDSME
ncbi:MAG: DUF2284 domain-containing protein [Oscillospiraceae bacterium]|nr:DUF2284 domain-containing protein [Oscillospiraceae bacterium]